jgi:tetratricopeptide (TPR) repeat protein
MGPETAVNLARLPASVRALLLLFLLLLAAPVPAGAEDPPPAPPPVPPGLRDPSAREAMWPAPTAADWEKPCLLTWQRTWEDAVSVARETGKAILVCINMDGEIASEHYAGVRYRQPEIAALYEPYVTVIASVYRHTPRDHDDQGRRIPCPRFGGVTCGEHIAIEPGIFEKFCDGQRVAPRHIMVELDGAGGAPREVYDVYYRNDTASVFEDIRKGATERPGGSPTVVRGDRPVVERVASREVTDRFAVERAFREGDEATRRALVEAAAKHPEAVPIDLLRLAIFGFDPELSRAARAALAKVEAPEATTLVAEALRVPMEAEERAALVATLKRLGGTSVLARWLAVVHEGLAVAPETVDARRWEEGLAGGTYPAPIATDSDLSSAVEERTRAAEAMPSDPDLRLAVGEAALHLALEAPTLYAAQSRRGRLMKSALLADAREAGLEAERLGAAGWRVNALLALSAYYAGDEAEGYARAAEAMKHLPAGDASWASMAVVTVHAEARWREVKKATKEKLDFPPSWLADLHSAYSILLKHPLGTDAQVLWHYDLLDWLGATDRATEVLETGIARFRESPLLHDRLRLHLLRHRDPAALEATYAGWVSAPDAPPGLVRFAAEASEAVGDLHRRHRRYEPATAAYGRAIALYDRAAAASEDRESIDAAAAVLLAGRARIAYQTGNDDAALEDLLASFARSPGAAGTRDGLGITPGETAQMLLARLREKGAEEAATRLASALAGLDPELLRPDRP